MILQTNKLIPANNLTVSLQTSSFSLQEKKRPVTSTSLAQSSTIKNLTRMLRRKKLDTSAYMHPQDLELRQQEEQANQDPNSMRYWIWVGNNHPLVASVFSQRKDWCKVNTDSAVRVNFIWRPVSYGLRFEKAKKSRSNPLILNHFEFHDELTTKSKLYLNLKNYWIQKALDVHDYVPMTYVIELFTSKTRLEQMRFTHYFKALSKAEDSNKKKRRLAERYLGQMPTSHYSGGNVWILKPSGFNRGQGIHIFDDISTFEQLIVDYKRLAKNQHQGNMKTNLKNRGAKFIVQKYIEDPMLYKGRKFDIRVWALLTHQGKLYMYNEGYIRTSSFKYEMQNYENLYIHLTNNAVQKNGTRYGLHEEGNQVSFEQFQWYLDANYPGTNFEEFYKPKMIELIKLTISATFSKLNPHQRPNWFELFGYDFMIDADSQMWLIEVNTNPWLELSSKLLTRLIPPMLQGVFMLTVDRIVKRKKEVEGDNNWTFLQSFN